MQRYTRIDIGFRISGSLGFRIERTRCLGHNSRSVVRGGLSRALRPFSFTFQGVKLSVGLQANLYYKHPKSKLQLLTTVRIAGMSWIRTISKHRRLGVLG